MPATLSLVGSEPRAIELTGLLERYVSTVTARAMVRNALDKAERTGDRSEDGLLRQLESTAKVLVPPAQRDGAIAAIRAAIDARRDASPPARDADADADADETVVMIRQEADVSPCRMVARDVCQLVGVRGYRAQKVVTGVSELARNIAHYAGEGWVRFRIDTQAEMIRVVAEDEGPGISNLEEVLAGNYRSRTGLGRGLIGVGKLADEFDIQTSERGTRVTVAFRYGAYS